jgi:hypothetical protein
VKASPVEWRRLRPTLAEFFVVDAGSWWHKRVEAEIESADKRKASAVAKAQAGGQALAKLRAASASSTTPSTASSTPQAVLGECPTPSPSLSTKEKAAAPLPDWLPVKEWKDFLDHRKAMRGVPFTEAARAGVIRDLDKLRAKGYSPADLLSTAITRGWRTVFEPKVNLAAPGDVARVTVPGPPPSSFLAEQAAHRAQVEAERIARKAKQTTGAH